MVLLGGCRIGFVEVKAPGKEPRPLQTNRHRMLRSLGFPVFVLDDPGQIPGILQEVAAWRRVIQLKDGSLHTVLGEQDILSLVEEKLGMEVRQVLEEFPF